MGSDPQPQVVQAGLRGLQTIQTSFVTPSLQDAYANYVRLAFRPALNRIGLERRTGEAETVAALRAELLGTLGEWGHDPEVMAKGRAIAKAYVADPKSADPALAETGLHLSALEGDAAAVRHVPVALREGADAERAALLSQLAGLLPRCQAGRSRDAVRRRGPAQAAGDECHLQRVPHAAAAGQGVGLLPGEL